MGQIEGDRAGWSLELSDDGTWVFIGYIGTVDAIDTECEGIPAAGGYAHLFHGGAYEKDWVQVGQDMALDRNLEGDLAGSLCRCQSLTTLTMWWSRLVQRDMATPVMDIRKYSPIVVF
jgi:hypothetical protein